QKKWDLVPLECLPRAVALGAHQVASPVGSEPVGDKPQASSANEERYHNGIRAFLGSIHRTRHCRRCNKRTPTRAGATPDSVRNASGECHRLLSSESAVGARASA